MASRMVLLALLAFLALCCQGKALNPGSNGARCKRPCGGRGQGQGQGPQLEELQSLSNKTLELSASLKNKTKGWHTRPWMMNAHINSFPIAAERANFSMTEAELHGHYDLLSRLAEFLELLAGGASVCQTWDTLCCQLRASVQDWRCQLAPGLANVSHTPAAENLVPESVRNIFTYTSCETCDLRDAIVLKDTVALVQALHWQYNHAVQESASG